MGIVMKNEFQSLFFKTRKEVIFIRKITKLIILHYFSITIYLTQHIRKSIKGWYHRRYISPYSVQMRKNTDQKNLRICTLFTQCEQLF